MKVFRSIVILLTVVSFTSVSIQAAVGFKIAPPSTLHAQNELSMESKGVELKKSASRGMIDGEMYGENFGSSGNFVGGFLIGALSGLIGTGIGYFVTGPARMDGSIMDAMQKGDEDYQLGFRTGWNKKTQSKKRNAFLGGGFLGTAAFVAIYLSVKD